MTTAKPRPPLAAGETRAYPVLPLRDIVVFPHMIVPLFVGREKSIMALEEMMRSDTFILLATQKNASDDDPATEAIYEIGTLASVLQLLKLPDGTVKVLVEGAQRAKMVKYTDCSKYYEAEAVALGDTMGERLEAEALARSATTEFESYVKLNKKVPPEVIGVVQQIEDYAKLADDPQHPPPAGSAPAPRADRAREAGQAAEGPPRRPEQPGRHAGCAVRHHGAPRRPAGHPGPVAGLHDRARRRLRLHPARPDLPARRPVVRRGPRLHQRHLPRPHQGHPARRPSSSGCRSASARPSSSCGSSGGRRRWRSRCATPRAPTSASSGRTTRTPGTPARGCSSSPTAWADAAGEVASSVAVGVLRDARRGLARRRPARPARQRRPHAPTTTCARWSAGDPELDGMSTTVTALLLRRRRGSAWCTSATAAATCSATGSCSRSPRTTPSCRRWSTRAGSPRRRPTHHPHRNLITNALRRPCTDVEPDLSVRETRRRRPLPAVQRRPVRAWSARRRCATCSAAEARTDVAVERAGRARPRGRQPRQHHRDRRRRRRGRDQAAVRGARHGRGGRRGRRSSTTASDTPAAKAAALRPAPEDDGRRASRTTAATHRAPPRPARCCSLVLLLAVVGAGTYGAYRWTQTQYYVGADGQNVAIYRGVTQDVGPVRTSRLYRHVDVALVDLPDLPAGAGPGRHRRPTAWPTPRDIVGTLRDQADALPRRCAPPTPTPSVARRRPAVGAPPRRAAGDDADAHPDADAHADADHRAPAASTPSDCGTAAVSAAHREPVTQPAHRRAGPAGLLASAIVDRRLRRGRPRRRGRGARRHPRATAAGWPLLFIAATSRSASSRRTPTRCCCRSSPRSTASGSAMIHRHRPRLRRPGRQLGRDVPSAAPAQLIWIDARRAAVRRRAACVVRDHRGLQRVHLHHRARRRSCCCCCRCCRCIGTHHQRRPDLDPARPASPSSPARSPRCCW